MDVCFAGFWWLRVTGPGKPASEFAYWCWISSLFSCWSVDESLSSSMGALPWSSVFNCATWAFYFLLSCSYPVIDAFSGHAMVPEPLEPLTLSSLRLLRLPDCSR